MAKLYKCNDCGREINPFDEGNVVDEFDTLRCADCSEKNEKAKPTLGNAVEQAEAALADLAGLAGTFYKELIDKGVEGVLAHDLVVNYMSGIFAGAQGREE